MIDGGCGDRSRWDTHVVVDEWMIRLLRHARFIVRSGRVMLWMLWVSSDSLGVACFRHAVALVLVVHRADVLVASLTVGMDGRREALILRHVVHLMHLMETHTLSRVFTRIDGMGLVTWIPGAFGTHAVVRRDLRSGMEVVLGKGTDDFHHSDKNGDCCLNFGSHIGGNIRWELSFAVDYHCLV